MKIFNNHRTCFTSFINKATSPSIIKNNCFDTLDKVTKSISNLSLGILLGLHGVSQKAANYISNGAICRDEGKCSLNKAKASFKTTGKLSTAAIVVITVAVIATMGVFGALVIAVTAAVSLIFSKRTKYNELTAAEIEQLSPQKLGKLSPAQLLTLPLSTIELIHEKLNSHIFQLKNQDLHFQQHKFVRRNKNICVTYAIATVLKGILSKRPDFVDGALKQVPSSSYNSSIKDGLQHLVKVDFNRARDFTIITPDGQSYKKEEIIAKCQRDQIGNEITEMLAKPDPFGNIMFSKSMVQFFFSTTPTEPDEGHHHRDNAYNLMTQGIFGDCTLWYLALNEDDLCQELEIFSGQSEDPINYVIDLRNDTTKLKVSINLMLLNRDMSIRGNKAKLIGLPVQVAWEIPSAILSSRPIDEEMDIEFTKKEMKIRFE